MACRFSTCLQLWQGKEVGYSWNSPTSAWRWIWPQWPKKAIRALQSRKRNILLRNHALRFEKRRRGMLSVLGITRWRLRYKDTRQCFVKTKHPAAFRAKWRRKESADTLQMQRNRCTSTRPTQSADSRAESPSAWHATRPTRPNQ